MASPLPLSPADLRKLQRLIDRTTVKLAAAHIAETALSEFCVEKYGFIPGDVDADQIIDAVLGGCGEPMGMAADEFDQIMRQSKRPTP